MTTTTDQTADLDTYAGHIAVTHRDGLRSSGFACGPVTVVAGEPGFDVVGGERHTLPASSVKLGSVIVVDGVPLAVKTAAKGRGRSAGFLLFGLADGRQLGFRPRDMLTIQARPHRRSFDARGGMSLTF